MNGIPAICYQTEGGSYLLHFRRATSADGSSWLDPVTVANKVHSVECGLEMVHGHPAVAFWHCPSMACYVMYARALDPMGDAWETPIMAAYTGSTGPVSLALAGGRPSVAFAQSRDDSKFYFNQATDTYGTTWGDKVWVVTGNKVQDITLGEVGGRPAAVITQYSYLDGVLFGTAEDPTGTSWGNMVLVGYGDPNIDYTTSSLALVHGTPATCFGGGNSYLNYVRAEDLDGMNWPEPLLLDGRGETGARCKLAVVGGYPFVAYADRNEYLYFVRGLDPAGTSWTTPERIADEVTMAGSGLGRGNDIHLVDINGYPALTYPTQSPRGINFAIYH
jgi:hypothetical protein